ncbi:MAG TPA: HlyD family efflux transporter periplasmic adaptor subunit [Noviherbaspirillum sp.]|uniref:HlyD family efflux transporter periplasmic adaptor subunit n=1 Tax=Noviherbaspirillum sp. TaxID=1926288 RepID=UPI002D4FD554|nr:HlyD family efflux transporter periplasmic adaptor subunit [Noviherbaspirillum sp.]HYD97111.1 HlyD family efflux transporter periplasmic adaptor subunit [Noviherbaspirillum sp.]
MPSSTVSIPSPATAPLSRPDIRLPALREDLQLLDGPVQADGSPSWRIHDPVRNRFFQIGWLECELLRRWQAGLALGALMASVARETTLRPTREECEELLAFLSEQQLLQAASAAQRERLRERWLRAQPHWLTWLLHHYLFFRIPLLRPDRFLGDTLRWVRPLFSKRFAMLLGALAVADAYFVVGQWSEVESAFSYFFNLEGLLYYFVAASVAKVVHELGHAYVAKHHGLRVPTVGVAFLVLWPVLYTDTSESWKLARRRDRFSIAAAGMGAEAALALFATLGWAIATDGVLRSMLFLLASSSLFMSLAINISPFMRFDGYFLLSDALDLPNLHERSFALAQRALRARFFGLQSPDPEPQLSRGLHRALVVFAIATWLFRFLLFLGIALVVYHLFFKLLGIFLMAVEIGWFIVRPVWREASGLWAIRRFLRPSPRAFTLLALAVAAGLWLMPVAFHVNAPALHKASTEQALYSPGAARLEQVAVRAGDAVAAGALLARLSSPEIASRVQRAESQVQALTVELARMPASERQRDRALVLEQQLSEAAADLHGAREDLARLELRAATAGVVRDLSPGLAPGRWLNPREPLMRVVAATGSVIEAWVDEEQLRGLRTGQPVRFFPDLPEAPVVSGRIVAIDPAGSHALPHPMLASGAGGKIAAVAREGGKLVTVHPVYRVQIKPDAEGDSPPAVERGTVRIATGPVALAENFLARIVAVLVRESGF